MGLILASASFAAQAFGANNLSLLRRSLRMRLWTGLLLSLPIMTFQLRGEHILLAFGQAPGAALLAHQYLSGVAWSVPPLLLFSGIRTFMSAVNRQAPVLWITLAGIPLNGLLVYLLTYGNLGLPRLELFGIGLATTVVNISSFLAALWFVTMAPSFRGYRALAQLWRLDWPLMRQLIVIGIPISMSLLLESGISSAAALLMGLISTKALAANQVALANWSMMPMQRSDSLQTFFDRRNRLYLCCSVYHRVEQFARHEGHPSAPSICRECILDYRVSLSYLLGFRIGLGATGVCVGLSIGAAGYAVLLVGRLHLLARRLALPKA
ncbi:MATE family efflux transporter [Bradyrhizobium sp. 147]|uniref:MATE family efflux transporter n=1 Tax=Bradyrhizobium sp. 147 TaxID=2782623 RepID=UPI001FFBF13E|nr:MATE family efflux transporter [Bradyrhizobium sp. 147]